MTTCLNAMTNKNNWVVDSGATDHMSYAQINRSNQLKELSKGSKAYLPNGQTIDISYKGYMTFTNGLKLRDVLHVPSFKYNMMSVSRLTKDNQCVVTFYPDFYLIQDCARKKLLGIGKEHQALYLLVNNPGIKQPCDLTNAAVSM